MFGPYYSFVFSFVLMGLLTAVANYDIRFGIIPNRINLAIFATGFVAVASAPGVDVVERTLASLIGFGFLWAVREAFKKVRGYDGIGMGDVKFVGAASIWVGLESIPAALAISCLAALLAIAMVAAMRGEFDGKRRIRFGPYLGAGFFVVSEVQRYTGKNFIDCLLSFSFQSTT